MSLYPDIKDLPNPEDAPNTSKKKILHFSDGTLEVDETDSIPPTEPESKSVSVNPQELAWIPWMWYQTATVGSKALEVCDYLGESLASFFGITTPKYQFEINEYNRLKKQEEEEAQNDIELGSWSKLTTDPKENAVLTGPKPTDSK